MTYRYALHVLLCTFFLFFFTHQAKATTVDTLIGRTAPKSVTRNAGRLAHYLCDGLTTDREKANAIYNWITHNIRYDINSFVRGDLKHDRVDRVLRKRKGVCEGYAYLFTDMCRAVGLNAVTIDGYARDWIFDDGDKLYVPRHAWNAVLIDGQWQLVDATWGAGGSTQSPSWVRRQINKISRNPVQSGKLRFVFRYDTSLFLQDPEIFRYTHLPTDPLWQLTDTVMPTAVFEAGRPSIEKFNEHSEPAQERDLLASIAGFSQAERVYDYAERAYAYNPKFLFPLALKEQIDAEIQLSDSLNTIDPMRYRIGKATRSLAFSKVCLQKQQEGYNEEYRALKQKNTQKNSAANKAIREIKADDKRLTVQCQLKSRSGKAKLHQISDKQAALNRITSDRKLLPATNKKPMPPNPALLTQVLDSTAARNSRLVVLKEQAVAEQNKLEQQAAANERRLDTLAGILRLSDSLLVRETIARINMHDNYDHEVIRYNTAFREARYGIADSVQKRYLRGYDTLLMVYNDRSKTELALANVYKTSLRALAKYGGADGNAEAKSQYAMLRNDFNSLAELCNRHLSEYRQAIAQHTEVFNALVKLYKRQDRLAGYMARAENKRKDLEAQTLIKKNAFNKRENKLQLDAVEKTMKRTKKPGGKLVG